MSAKAGEIDAGMQLRVEPGDDIKLLLTEEEANEVGLRFFRLRARLKKLVRGPIGEKS